MITDRIPAVAWATTKRGTEVNPLFIHTAVLVIQHNDTSTRSEIDKAKLTRAIYKCLYQPIQDEIAKAIGIFSSNPVGSKRRVDNLLHELQLHTTL